MYKSKIEDKLFFGLEEEKVRYAHWKSNYQLFSPSKPTSDVEYDLLIDRKQITKFVEIISRIGFKQGEVEDASFPAVHHFYNYDHDAGRFIDIHVYYKIITGESFVKNYNLPFVDEILDNTVIENGIRIPVVEIEWIMFIVRIMLKYSIVPENFIVHLSKKEIYDELLHLEKNSNFNVIKDFLKKYHPNLSLETLQKCSEALKKEKSLISLTLLALKIRKIFKVNRRKTGIRRWLMNLKTYGNIICRRFIFRKKRRLFFGSGGILIAIIGPEATGKSTIISELNNWLKRLSKVDTIHSGKPPTTFLTYIPDTLTPMLRRLMPKFRSTSVEQENIKDADNKPTNSTSMPFIIRSIIIAYKRKKQLSKIHRIVSNGGIIISDRYPTNKPGLVDSPQLIPSNFEKLKGGVKYRMMKYENKLYNEIQYPNLILQLTAPLDVVLERNSKRIKSGKEDEKFVRFRHSQFNSNFFESNLHEINTNRDMQIMLKDIKKIVWKYL